jgi:phosphoribosyl-AMP cyclohydrolase
MAYHNTTDFIDPNFPIPEIFPAWMDAIHFDALGLVMAICQDEDTGENLMVAYVNRTSLWHTVARSEMIFWSRSRKEYWHKGGTSGNVLQVRSFAVDCDGDVLQFQVKALGDQAACHTGRRSCFFRTFDPAVQDWKITSARVFDPTKVYGEK